MLESRRLAVRRIRNVVVVFCLLGSALLLLARVVPGEWGDSESSRRLAYAVAFFTRTFESHAALGMCAGVGFLILLRNWAACTIAAIVPAVVLAPTVWTYVRPDPEPLSKSLTVLTANLLVGHTSVDRVVRLIEAEAPDVIFFQEYTPAKAEKLIERLGAAYPYRVEGMREHSFGAAIYSRRPFVGRPELFPHEAIRGHVSARNTGEVGIWDPQPRAVVQHGDREIVLQNVHFAPPIRIAYLREQRVMTDWLCRWLESERRAVVIAGDFNSTDSSANLGDLRRAGLVSVRAAGRGLMGTWPSSGIAGLVPVGIDHILIRGLRSDRAHVGGAIDSDHLPLVARVGLE